MIVNLFISILVTFLYYLWCWNIWGACDAITQADKSLFEVFCMTSIL